MWIKCNDRDINLDLVTHIQRNGNSNIYYVYYVGANTALTIDEKDYQRIITTLNKAKVYVPS